jgi:hypothetical protein
VSRGLFPGSGGPFAALARCAATATACVVLLSGCGAAPGSPGPVGQSSAVAASHTPGPPGLDWAVAAHVERPEGMSAEPPAVPPVSSRGGGLGHPGHFSGQGDPFDVARIDDRLVAPGYTFPEFHAVTWSSTDREHWSLAPLPPGSSGAFGLAIAAGGDHGNVIVGRVGNDAAAWWSTDGVAWQPVDGGAAFVEPPETRMTAVVSTPSGFVAGGFAGISNQPGTARFWTSNDGRSWIRVVDTPAFADGRVTSIVAAAGRLVAVGTTGRVGQPTGSAVWRSADGTSWERVPGLSALAAGAMAAVTTGGPGLVAVGANLDSTKAIAWRSKDGLSWQLAPDQDSLTFHGLRITMADVTAGSDGTLVAVGHFLFGQQFGQGTAWTSKDGSTWTRAEDLAAFGQGEPGAVIADGTVYVAVGTVGAPDNYIPTVWLSPPGR